MRYLDCQSKKLSLYFHTIRYLKYSQWYWQCVRRIYHPKITTQINPIQIKPIFKRFMTPYLYHHMVFKKNNISFLNEDILYNKDIWTQSQEKSKLWQYNLQYFYSILSNDRDTVILTKKLLQSWLVACPLYSKPAWDPYPISIRISNLIKYQLMHHDLSHKVLDSLYLQARYLYKIPEYHLLGNHLLENARALVFAGGFFQGDEPSKWFRLGMKILHREIPEQILDDGGYFELSPMYHSLILELMLDLYNFFKIYQIEFPVLWLERLQKMRYWLKAMTHPDGEIAFFNDTAIGIATAPDRLEKYANRLQLPIISDIQNGITHLKKSGFIRLQREKIVAILDCANIGPDYQPAHAHADTLSFELSIDGQRCIVNAGTSVYRDNPVLRQWQRGTASHSTVEINHRNSSDIWGVFRVGKRAYPCDLAIEDTADEWVIRCGHTGYQSLHTKHIRVWKLKNNTLLINDYCDTELPAISRYYLHPNVVVHKLSLLVGQNKISVHADADIKIESSEYYPEFGKIVPSHVITQEFLKNSNVQFSW